MTQHAGVVGRRTQFTLGQQHAVLGILPHLGLFLGMAAVRALSVCITGSSTYDWDLGDLEPLHV